MKKQPLDRLYTSEIDKFLAEFDKKQGLKSPAQKATIAKHAKIARLRDKKAADSSS